MKLFYNTNDAKIADDMGMARLFWLDDIGAIPIQEAHSEDKGYYFGFNQGIEHYRKLLVNFPYIHDLPEEREELHGYDRIFDKIKNIDIPIPRTWILELDQELPSDINFPLFLRTAKTYWKRGGTSSYVRNMEELVDEVFLLRNSFGWDATIIVRKWLQLSDSGSFRYGVLPIEVRVWIVDHIPYAWSFHHMHVIKDPLGFPLSSEDVSTIKKYSWKIANLFRSRLFVADFVKDKEGQWYFVEADPGSCAGTGHEKVFKSVANCLLGKRIDVRTDLGGVF